MPLRRVRHHGEEVAGKARQDGEGMTHHAEADEVVDALVGEEVGALGDGGEAEVEDGRGLAGVE
jgi:hypothetical protein